MIYTDQLKCNQFIKLLVVLQIIIFTYSILEIHIFLLIHNNMHIRMMEMTALERTGPVQYGDHSGTAREVPWQPRTAGRFYQVTLLVLKPIRLAEE